MHTSLTIRAVVLLGAVGFITGCEPGCGDTSRDEMNCGGCGVRCLPWLDCLSGVCGCPSGAVACGAGCATLMNDPEHCGRCDLACPDTASCESGRCQCAEGFGVCGDRCLPLANDPMNCGACDTVCGPGQICADGACVCGDASLDPCPDGCVDLSSAEESCGACGARCPVGATCSDGSCGCPSSRVVCDDRCVDLQTDPLHCAGCGRECASELSCVDGTCACPAGQTHCGAACVNTDSDLAHCGACSVACGESETCSMGRCVPGYRWHVTHTARGFMASWPAWDGRVAVSDDGHVYLAYTEDPGGSVTLLRYSPSGVELWSRVFSTNSVRVDDIAIGASGDLVMAATFRWRWRSPGESTHTTSSQDVAIVAVDPGGSVLWERFVESSGSDSAGGVVVRGDRVVVSGGLGGRFDFGGGSLWADTYRDAFIYEMRASDGAYVAARVYGAFGTEEQVFVALAADGDFFVAGISGAGVDFGAGRTSTTSGGFVARLGPDFTHRWSRSIPAERIFGLAVLPDGRVVVGGEVVRTTDFGAGVSLTLTRGTADYVLALDGATGDAAWVGGVEGDWGLPGRGPVVDARGNVWMGASVRGPIGTYDAILMGYDSRGRNIYLRAFGSEEEDVATGLATAADTLVMAGRFRGTAVFGSTSERSSNRDVFMMVFDL